MWRVNRANLQPGDRVLFRGGETFSDDALMPGHGVVGVRGPRPAGRFGSYGGGRATLPYGIWLGATIATRAAPAPLVQRARTRSSLRVPGYRRLHLADQPEDHRPRPRSATNETGIETEGSHWVIAHNVIDRTGDSGMLLGFDSDAPGIPAGGVDYTVYDNLIDHTGLDPRITVGTHGIYLKVANATVLHNRILNFHNNGVSVRYRNARIVDNDIEHGSIGIAWFQYDTKAGMSAFIGKHDPRHRLGGDLRLRLRGLVPPAAGGVRDPAQPAPRGPRRADEPRAQLGQTTPSGTTTAEGPLGDGSQPPPLLGHPDRLGAVARVELLHHRREVVADGPGER